MDVWNSMQISFDITEKEIAGPDGETVVALFNKRERFINYVPLIKNILRKPAPPAPPAPLTFN